MFGDSSTVQYWVRMNTRTMTSKREPKLDRPAFRFGLSAREKTRQWPKSSFYRLSYLAIINFLTASHLYIASANGSCAPTKSNSYTSILILGFLIHLCLGVLDTGNF